MKVILYPFMVLAGLGLALSIAAHCMALAGIPIPGGKLVWGLHIGIFIVWIPTVLTSMQTTRYANRKDFWKVALAGCPLWMRRAGYIFFGYAILNFIVFMATTVCRSRLFRPLDDFLRSSLRCSLLPHSRARALP